MHAPSIDAPGLTLSELMYVWPETIQVYFRYRIMCVGCVFARFHTVVDACREHGVDEVEFRAALREAVRART